VSNWKKFIVGFDLHGDRQHEHSVKVFRQFINIWKPSIRVMGGDLWDFRPLRRKANEDERRDSMAQDFEAGMKFLEQFQPTHFLRGNHDERLWELALLDKGIESDYAMQGVQEISDKLREIHCRMLPYHKRTGVLKIGHLKVLHGFHTGIYASRQMALIYGACLFGHIHTIDEHAIPGLERRVARCCGCLCELDMDYNARQTITLRQAHGFAYGIVNDKTGDFHVWQGEEINGQWILPTDTVTL
jgi:hypothetical protein